MHFISKKSRNLKALQSWKPATELVWCSIRRPLMEYFSSHSTSEGGHSDRQYPSLAKAIDWMLCIKRTEAKHSTTPTCFCLCFPCHSLVFLISTSQGDLCAHKLPPPPLPPYIQHSCRSKYSCLSWTSLQSLFAKFGLLDTR